MDEYTPAQRKIIDLLDRLLALLDGIVTGDECDGEGIEARDGKERHANQ